MTDFSEIRPVSSPCEVVSYIFENWERSVCVDRNGSGAKGIDLPHPYTTPCIRGEGKFSFFFYWDNYFTNLGLLRCGQHHVARDNIRNIFWFIARQGYMPNHTGIFNRSQPPYLCRMVEDYVAATRNDAFLAEAAPFLRQEYHFWITARHSPTGLQRYGHHETKVGCIKFYDAFLTRRLGKPRDATAEEKHEAGAQALAEAESGWDFTPRFSGRCMDFNPTDLNALLFSYEMLFAGHARDFGWDDAALWEERAERRKSLVNSLLWDASSGWFRDFDYVGESHSPVKALSGLMPLFCGMAAHQQAECSVCLLQELEREHGLAVTQDLPEADLFQWAFPNVWPPMVWVAVSSLERYGFSKDSRRIAGKFVRTTRSLFARTGRLWEKTDALSGGVAGGEYEAASMLGWTAGVYLACLESLEKDPHEGSMFPAAGISAGGR